MRIKRIAIAVALCCFGILAVSSPASAQMGMGRSLPAFGGTFNPVVGVGADYDMTTAKGEQMTVGMGIVGKDTINGATGYWMQMTMAGPKIKNGPMYVKLLSVKNGNQVTTARMIMGVNGQAFQMPDQMIKTSPTDADVASTATAIGTETITVPAGTFSTTHYKTKDGADIWTMNNAGPWGLVKMHASDGTTMVLTKTYTDAKDMLTGPVQTFPGMSK